VTNASDNLGRGPADKPEPVPSEEGASAGPRLSDAPPPPQAPPVPAPQAASGRKDAKRAARRAAEEKQLPIWQEMFLLLGIALVLAIVIKAFFMQAFYIPSGSMNDTLVLNDRILVQKVSYWGGGTPQRGDIVVFADPGGWLDESEVRAATNPVTKTLELFGLYPTGGHLVKRVVGVGGDRVVCCDPQGRVTVNGVPLNEKAYLMPGANPSDRRFDVTVPKGRLWVMGDNRGNSEDSRFHQELPGAGTVPEDDVVGKVWAIVWPFGRAHLLREPGTFENPKLRATDK
jgi:signal peptidase I